MISRHYFQKAQIKYFCCRFAEALTVSDHRECFLSFWWIHCFPISLFWASPCAREINKYIQLWVRPSSSAQTVVLALMKQQSAPYHREALCLQLVGGGTVSSWGRLDPGDQLGQFPHQSDPPVELQTTLSLRLSFHDRWNDQHHTDTFPRLFSQQGIGGGWQLE